MSHSIVRRLIPSREMNTFTKRVPFNVQLIRVVLSIAPQLIHKYDCRAAISAATWG